MTIAFLASPHCPRCGGVLYRDPVDDEIACLPCGWRETREATPAERYEPGKRRRLPTMHGEVRRVDRRLGPLSPRRCGGKR
jgi:uncharacterized Zn finger protein (UPF0148 family)